MRSPKRFPFLAALALAAAVPATAKAQGIPESTEGDLLSPVGAYFLLGGGVADFTGSAMRERFDVGGAWDARLGIGSRFYVGGELAYVGSAMNAAGDGPDLFSNGAEGILRLQYPYATGRWRLEPFAFGGVGWSHVELRDAPAGVAGSDDVGVVPFGGGITVGYDRLLLDARFTYRTHFSENLALRAGEGAADLESWAVGASLGWEL